ncbi:MAG: acyltransferase [Actinobacteria bacterium]|nr:acyltransferase [Actinomycetota bacterium]
MTAGPAPAPAPVSPRRAGELAASTPASRDRYVDFLRLAAIAVVVLGHWLMLAVDYRDGRLAGGNLLELEPWTQWLTWAFQPMPVFFIVGGYANAASWAAARRDSLGYAAWLHGRLSRLLRPTLVFAGVGSVVGLVLTSTVGGEAVERAVRLIALPVWFLAVYVVICAAGPALVAGQRRFGHRLTLALVAGAALVDVAHWNLGVPLVGWLNFALVWGFAHQLGVTWQSLRLPRPAGGIALAAGGVGALVVLTQLGGYPVALVGGDVAGRTNNSPPSLALVALATLQFGIVALVAGPVRRWLQRRRPWELTVAGNGIIMTVFLWHLTAAAVVTVLLAPRRWFPHPELASGAWWALRPAWVALLLVALVPFVAAFRRFEAPSPRRAGRQGRRFSAQALAGALSAAAGLSLLALHGFDPVPLPALALLAIGQVLSATSTTGASTLGPFRRPKPARRRPSTTRTGQAIASPARGDS